MVMKVGKFGFQSGKFFENDILEKCYLIYKCTVEIKKIGVASGLEGEIFFQAIFSKKLHFPRQLPEIIFGGVWLFLRGRGDTIEN